MEENTELEQARERFTRNYLDRAQPGAPMSWLEENIEPLLRIAVPSSRPHRFTPMLAAKPVRQPAREKILINSLDRLAGVNVPEPEAALV